MINIFLFLGAFFLLTFLIGRFIEKARVPWIFAALILGAMLAVYNPFASVTSSETFLFLGQLGMYFLLFVIGFEIDMRKMRKRGRFILKSMFFIILLEAAAGTAVVHFVFGYSWFISALVALSFATVGEAVLIPILDEFGIVNTALGQTIIGIGTLDDIIEILALILAVMLAGSAIQAGLNVYLVLASLLVLFILTMGFSRLKKRGRKFNFLGIETLFLFVIFVLFIFLGVGEYAGTAPLAALLAGISLRTFLPKARLACIESEVKTVCYGLFAPIFFLWVGLSMDMNYLVTYPLLVLLVVAVSNGAKLLGSYIAGRGTLGIRKSILLGTGLSVRFSTSIIIIKILFDSGLVQSSLYSVIVASSIVFTFAIPLLFSNLLVRWGEVRAGG